MNVAGKGFIPSDLITRCNEVIFSFSDWEGNPSGESAVFIVEDAGGNIQGRFLSVEPL